MTEAELIGELNKVITLEHGHLGMYKEFIDYQDKEVSRTFKIFLEIEIEHINKLESVMRNLGANPSILIEGGDILGRMMGVTINKTSMKTILQTYSFIEKKSHIGYMKFISKLDQAEEKRTQFIAEFLASNMLESKMMHLWLEDYLKQYQDL